jgi:hypothetical protein
VLVPAGAASADSPADAAAMFQATNQARTDNGLGALQYDAGAASVAIFWANQLASSGTLQHNPNLVTQIETNDTTAWTRIGENVGFGPSVSSLQTAFMNSAPHKANILGDFNRLGVGATRDGNGTLWVVLDFVNGPAIAAPPPPPPPPPPSGWYMRSTPTPGAANISFDYGIAAYQFLSGDFTGDGTDTVATYINGWWYIRNSNTPGAPDLVINYGAPGYIPVVGDWNGDGKDTIGTYYNGWWYLRNSNTPGPPDLVIHYGDAALRPVVGDWNGDGKDTIGTYFGGWWYLRNTNTPGWADTVVNYGAPGYIPVTGDWSGPGPTGIATVVTG